MPYIGHNPTQAGSFVLLDDIASGFDGDDVTFTLQIGGVDITPTADNLIIALDGVIQHSPEAYTVSGSTLTFATGPASGVDFYGMLMGQSASIGQGAIGADELSVTGDGSANQMLVSDGDGTMTWKGSGLSATSATGDIIYRNSSGELARLAVGSAGQVLTVASGVPAWETDVESYLPLSGGTMSGALNMGSQAITNAGTITGTFSGNLTGNVTGNTSGTAASVTGASQGSITSVGTLTGLSVNSSVDGNWVAQIKNTDADNGYGLYVAAGDDASVKSFCVANKDDSDKFYVTGDGNATFAGTVLISQSGSETPLHIKNTNTGAGQNCYLKIENDGGADTYLNFLQGSSNGYIKYTDEGDMIFQTAGMNNRLSIDSSGATFAGDVTISNSIPLLYMNDTSGAKNNQIFFQAGGTSYFRIGTDITTNNGTEALEITDGGGSNARLTINSSGNSIFGGTIQSTGSITLGSAGSHSNLLWIASTNGTADIGMDDGYLRFRTSAGKNMIFMPGDAGTKVTFETDGTVQFAGTATFQSNTTFAEYLKHDGDSDTFIRFTDNAINFSTGNSTALTLGGTVSGNVIRGDTTIEGGFSGVKTDYYSQVSQTGTNGGYAYYDFPFEEAGLYKVVISHNSNFGGSGYYREFGVYYVTCKISWTSRYVTQVFVDQVMARTDAEQTCTPYIYGVSSGSGELFSGANRWTTHAGDGSTDCVMGITSGIKLGIAVSGYSNNTGAHTNVYVKQVAIGAS